MNLEEALEASVTEDVATINDSTIVVNNDLRTMSIPEKVSILGVESDESVNRLKFRLPRYYCDLDLGEFNIYVNYLNGRTEDIYVVTDKKTTSEYVEFSWLVGRNASKNKGYTKFVLCLKKSGSDGTVIKEFNTTVHKLEVLEGLETEVDSSLITQNKDLNDLIDQIKIMIDLEGEKVISNLPKDYQELANEVKTLKDETSQLKESIGDFGDTYINVNYYANAQDGYITKYGNFVEDQSSLITEYISVKPTDSFLISGFTQYSVAGYAFYDTTKKFIASGGYDGTNAYRFTNLKVVVPDGANYIRFSTYRKDEFPYSIQRAKKYSAGEKVKELSNILLDVAKKNNTLTKKFLKEEFKNSSKKAMDISGEGIATVETDGTAIYCCKDNVYDFIETTETTINGITYSIDNGIITINGTATKQFTINFAEILPKILVGNAFYLKAFLLDGNFPSDETFIITRLNANYNIVLTNSNTEVYINGLKDVSDEYPCIYITQGSTYHCSIGIMLAYNKTYLDNYKNGYVINTVDKIITLGDNIWCFSDGIITIKKYIEYNLQTFENNPLFGKSLYCVGDSVCEGAGSNKYSYADIIAEKNNMILTKDGIGGTTYSVIDGKNNSICERIASVEGNFDYVLLEGIFNDIFASINIGQLTADYNSTVDNKTVTGALEEICRNIKKKFPEAKILFIIPHKLSFSNGVLYANQNKYFDAVRAVSEKYQIKHIDLDKISGLACYNEEWLKNYFGPNETMGTHPNKNAYEKYYVPFIESEMKNS
ncbi:MAG: SGNH/GDSL hydrolase family protein [Clostridia bacterium]